MADNNSTGNTTLDSSLDSIFGNSNNNTVPPATTNGQGMNVQQLIGGLLQAGGKGLNSAGNAMLPPSQQIIQDVATKAYTKQIQDHADAVPHQILGNLLDQWAVQGGAQSPTTGGNTPNASQVASSQLTPQGGQTQSTPSPTIPTGNQPSTSSSVNQQAQPSIDDQIANLNKQAALNVAKKNLQSSQPQTFTQRFNQQFTKLVGGQTQQEELANRGLIQKMAGAEPIQPKDVADLNARSYTAAMDAAHNGITAEAQKLTGLEDLYGKEQPNRNAFDIAMGRESGNQSIIRKNIETSAENISNHLQNLRTLVTNRPTFSSQGMNQQTQDLVNKIKEGQTATNTKTGAKIVYKGGKWLNQ